MTKKNFAFMVSFFALFAVNSVLSNDVAQAADNSVGIAAVSYVDRALESYATKDEIPTKVSELTNDKSYATMNQLSEKAPGRFKAVNSAVVTDADGNVSTGLITNDMLDTGIAQDKVSGLVTVLGRKEDTANKLTAADTTTIVNDNNKDILYPSVGRVAAMIPTVNNGGLIIVNGATRTPIGRFAANQSGNSEITIPVATAEVAGLAKLYNAASDANDGAMTAKQVTYRLGLKLDASKYGYIPTKSDGTGEALIWVE